MPRSDPSSHFCIVKFLSHRAVGTFARAAERCYSLICWSSGLRTPQIHLVVHINAGNPQRFPFRYRPSEATSVTNERCWFAFSPAAVAAEQLHLWSAKTNGGAKAFRHTRLRCVLKRTFVLCATKVLFEPSLPNAVPQHFASAENPACYSRPKGDIQPSSVTLQCVLVNPDIAARVYIGGQRSNSSYQLKH